MIFLLIFILSIFLVGASVSLKYHLVLYPLVSGFSVKTIIDFIITCCKSPFAWLALIFTLSGTTMWIYIINRYPLSQVYPMISVAYVLMMVVDYFIFKQPITLTKVAGVASIFLGVWFLSR
jgi:drug/metabolite transporter (DMT)-like permease